jgi:hypothetical protein
MRFLAALPLVLTLLVPAPSVGAPGPGPPRHELTVALGVLHEWDDRRARAWAAGDTATLRSLYVAGSVAARSDVRLLRAYTARGLVVRRLVTQVFAVRVLEAGPATLRLAVFDRVAGGVVDDGAGEATLPSSRPARRTVSFRVEQGSWRVAAVSDSGSGPRGGRR